MKPVPVTLTLLILLASLSPLSAVGQGVIPYDSVCCMPYVKRAEWLDMLAQRLAVTGDKATGLKTIEEIKKYAASQNSEEFMLEAQLLEVAYLEVNHPEEKDRLLGLIEDGIARSKKARLKPVTVRFLSLLQQYCNKLADYPLKFSALNEMEQLLETMTEDEIYDKAFYYIHIANTYFHFQEYRNVIQRLQTILSWNNPVNPRTAFGIWHAHNTLGLCYRKLGMPDSSDYYFEKIRNEPFIKNHRPQLYAIATGNLGINHYMRGEYAAALPMLRIDIAGSLKAGDYDNAVGSMTPLADILLLQGHYKESKSLLDSIGNYIDRYRIDLVDRRVKYYPLLAAWYQATGQPAAATVAFDSALKTQREYDHKYNQLKVSMFEQRLKIRDYESERIQNKARNREYALYAVILTVFLSALAAYFRMTYKKDRRIKKLQLLETQQELEIASLKLNEYTRNLMAKNREIESLQEKVRSVEEWDMVNDLKTVTLITEEDWDNFRHSFDRVHTGFTARMNTLYPQLSAAEQRLMMLIKLRLSPQEMALMLGISAESVRIAHYRLRQKLGLSQKQELNELVEKISKR